MVHLYEIIGYSASAMGFVVLWGPLLDERFGNALLERVEVQEKRFVAAKPRYPNDNNDCFSPQSDSFNLRVANQSGGGWVRVSPRRYKRIKQGDVLFVSGKRGRITKHWYLESASQNP